MKLWCNSHRCFASKVGKPIELGPLWTPGAVHTLCDAFQPGGHGGILLPCQFVDLDEIVEIVNDDEEFSPPSDRGDAVSFEDSISHRKRKHLHQP